MLYVEFDKIGNLVQNKVVLKMQIKTPKKKNIPKMLVVVCYYHLRLYKCCETQLWPQRSDANKF